jgi:hypothetical protein
MQQLKMLGNVQQAKYRQVSLQFLAKHQLGPFAVGDEKAIELVETSTEAVSATATTSSTTKSGLLDIMFKEVIKDDKKTDAVSISKKSSVSSEKKKR